MGIGWIDFSQSDRNKVHNVLALLSEPGTLDELGIAPVRDGFANIFFPGTSTIQTRAKYFFIIPYILKDLERDNEIDPYRMRQKLNEEEKKRAQYLLDNSSDIDGIIGSRALKQNDWVKRTPVDIYWSGLRNYGIITVNKISLSEYLFEICESKKRKNIYKNFNNRKEEIDDNDDTDAGYAINPRYLQIPTYNSNWKETLDIRLTRDEGDFLRKQITSSFPNSMLSHILRNKIDITNYNNFMELQNIISIFPEEIQDDYSLALDFSNFLYVLRTIYNIMISNGENKEANSEWKRLEPNLTEYATLNLRKIVKKISNIGDVFEFLAISQKLMQKNDIEGLKKVIKKRECNKKDPQRAKTMHPGEFNPNEWYGGKALDYRFNNAKVLIRDIFASEAYNA